MFNGGQRKEKQIRFSIAKEYRGDEVNSILVFCFGHFSFGLFSFLCMPLFFTGIYFFFWRASYDFISEAFFVPKCYLCESICHNLKFL